ncbi:hypothetical protein GCM10023193_10660 [Planotetraspora kaengkrachanensis]|uniref:Uncharacterized protein n=2 Tax=Planotetraspora kaengkrachanensis TaxID=575193 RepID=A0A8J3LVX2_9ACTN|nr:hypothetical protein Pka01_06150 [Planotetraspora kaengkrachanensis]
MSVLGSWLRATIEADKAVALATEQDPRDTIARCDAALAVLDEHGIVQVTGIGKDTRVMQIPACKTCGTKHGVPCRTLRLLARGYRHREGYDDEWSPE